MFKKFSLLAIFLSLFTTVALANSAKDISQQALQKIMSADNKGKVVLLDVRTPQEYAAGHVPGAINISHTEIKANLAKLLPHKNDTVIVYCRSGHRAGIAAEILANNGFTKLQHLSGDMNGWYEAKLPIEK
ncbi:MAG: sulfurtransferase [Gammaproteobacteria bacterium]|nr:MAG: sulfurtransferase [Gammaproteobacteria bacterium]